MPRVDTDDDSSRRWVLRHYRYDPHRRQRRHVFVAAFDDKREFEAAMAQEQLSRQRGGELGQRRGFLARPVAGLHRADRVPRVAV